MTNIDQRVGCWSHETWTRVPWNLDKSCWCMLDHATGNILKASRAVKQVKRSSGHSSQHSDSPDPGQLVPAPALTFSWSRIFHSPCPKLSQAVPICQWLRCFSTWRDCKQLQLTLIGWRHLLGLQFADCHHYGSQSWNSAWFHSIHIYILYDFCWNSKNEHLELKQLEGDFESTVIIQDSGPRTFLEDPGADGVGAHGV